jgi:hypothetical protein
MKKLKLFSKSILYHQQNTMSVKKEEVEVYRLDPKAGKYYETAEYTRKTGTWGEHNERYYTKNPPRYVGLFLRTERSGYGDSGRVWSIFDDNGKQVQVEYSYEGTTSFRETTPPFEYVFK